MKLDKPIFTFSFDDGHPNDLKLALLFKKYSIKATFYITIQNSENPVMTPSEIRKIHSMGFEIGSHGLTHRRLPAISLEAAEQEVFLSKKKLEKMLGEKVKAYCFAGGKYQTRHLKLPLKAGYLFSRTTRLLRLCHPVEGSLLHTTMQYYPLTTLGYLKHLVRRPNVLAWRLFFNSIGHCGFNAPPKKLGRYLIDMAISEGGCFHLHGHSYEFSSKRDWKEIEELLEYAGSKKQCRCLNNSETFLTLSASRF